MCARGGGTDLSLCTFYRPGLAVQVIVGVGYALLGAILDPNGSPVMPWKAFLPGSDGQLEFSQ